MDEITRQLVADALSNGPILLRPHAGDSEIVRLMVKRAKEDRRFMARVGTDRRKVTK